LDSSSGLIESSDMTSAFSLRGVGPKTLLTTVGEP
jgi:hypothetical protein